MGLLFSTTYISVDLAHHVIVRAEVGKGGINSVSPQRKKCTMFCFHVYI